MSLETRQIELECEPGPKVDLNTVAERLAEVEAGASVLRWGVIGRRDKHLRVEYAVTRVSGVHLCEKSRPIVEGSASTGTAPVVMVVPTGVGAAIGGYIGDASPVARVIGSVSGSLITHPNVLNAAALYGGSKQTLYVDGLTLDRFLLGLTFLERRPAPLRVGVLIDALKGSDLQMTLLAIESARAVFGVDVVRTWISTEKVLATTLRHGRHFVGRISNPEVLMDGARHLREMGAEAIAIVTDISGVGQDDLELHYQGQAVNPVGATEALISRFVTSVSGLPAAHAPAFGDTLGLSQGPVDPRVAAEPLSRSGLLSVLVGLGSAARPTSAPGGIRINSVAAVVAPFECSGGIPALGASKYALPFVAVRENTCKVGLACSELAGGLRSVPVDTYCEAIALLAAMRAGVSFESIRGVTRPWSLSTGTVSDV